jgi:hypothetical protein
VDSASAEKAEIDMSFVGRSEDREQRFPHQIGGADLAIALAFFDPHAAFVRGRDGEGTSVMRRERAVPGTSLTEYESCNPKPDHA